MALDGPPQRRPISVAFYEGHRETSTEKIRAALDRLVQRSEQGAGSGREIPSSDDLLSMHAFSTCSHSGDPALRHFHLRGHRIVPDTPYPGLPSRLHGEPALPPGNSEGVTMLHLGLGYCLSARFPFLHCQASS